MFWPGGARSNEPMRWREPDERKRSCPECGARLIVSTAEDRCPYCTYHKSTRLVPRERDTSVLQSLKSQITDDIVEAIPYRRRRFVSFEVPRELETERSFLYGLLALQLVVSRLYHGGRYSSGILGGGQVSDTADRYIMCLIIAPLLFTAFNVATTFVSLKWIGMVFGILSCLGAIALLLSPGLWQPHMYGSEQIAVGWQLLAYQALHGLWTASYFHRENKLLQW